jgi:hypothetical protein
MAQRPDDHVMKLKEYVKKNLKKGYNEDSVRWALIKQKESRTLVEKAIEIAKKEIEKETPKKEFKQESAKIEFIEPEPKKGFFTRLFRR